MLRSPLVLSTFALAALFALAIEAADKKKDQDAEDIALQKHQKVLAAARKRVETVAMQAGQARNAVDKAENLVRKQRAESDKVREATIESENDTPPLAKARKELDEAEAQLQAVSMPILRRLAQEITYQGLVRERDQTRQQMELAPANAKEEFAAAALSAAQAVAKSEQAALAADPAAVALRKARDEARTRLQLLVDERDRRIAQDSVIQKAMAKLASAKQQLDSAQETAQRATRELANVQRQLQAEEQEHKRLALAEQRDDARDKAAAQKKNKKK